MVEIINTGWHILLCQPNRELTAVAGLTDRGFEAMCPASYMRRRTGKRDASGQVVMSKEPWPKAMMPGYAFVKFETAEPDYDGVKKAPGVRGFYRVVGENPLKPRYAVLSDNQIADLREADQIAFDAFQQSVMPKSKRKPDVEFVAGKSVRFTTKFGQEIYGQMLQKKGGGMVKIMAEHMSYLVSHFDIQDGEAA